MPGSHIDPGVVAFGVGQPSSSRARFSNSTLTPGSPRKPRSLARLRAALRRATPDDSGAPVVATAHFTIDLPAKRVLGADEVEIRLTPTEWGIVEVLVRNHGRLVSQTQLLREVWGPQYGEETNYLRVFMAQVRRKLEPEPGAPRYFITEPGMGYRFELPEPDEKAV